MDSGLNTYGLLGAFDSNAGNHYVIFCNRDMSRFLPVMLYHHQKEYLVAHGTSGSTRDMGIYTGILDMWVGMGLKLIGMRMRMSSTAGGRPLVEVDMVLSRVGDDGISVIQVPFPIPDAAMIAVVTGVPIISAPDTSAASTMATEGEGVFTHASAMASIMGEINGCETALMASKAKMN